MNTKRRVIASVAMIPVMAWPASAADGVLVVERTTTGASVRESRIEIEPRRIRVELSEAGGAGQVVVFDGTRQVMWMIDPPRKSYTEITSQGALPLDIPTEPPGWLPVSLAALCAA
jgi:hypothetical protein